MSDTEKVAILKKDLIDSFKIHPTSSEEMMSQLNKTLEWLSTKPEKEQEAHLKHMKSMIGKRG